MTSISALSRRSISPLFNSSSTQGADATAVSQTQPVAATGHTDDALKTGDAVGKIIEIVSGMSESDTLFDMKNAQRTYAANGGYSETLTGTGTVVSDEKIDQDTTKQMQETASGIGPAADWAKAYLDADARGQVQKTDMSTMGVTSTMTETNYYYADGSQKGGPGSWNTQGMGQFLQKNVTIKDGVMYDKSDNYATMDMNGTKFTLLLGQPVLDHQPSTVA